MDSTVTRQNRIYGNYVPGTAAPKTAPKKKERRDPEEERKYLELTRKRIDARAREKQNGIREMNVLQTMCLFVSLVTVLCLSALFLFQSAENMERKNEIYSLEKEVAELRESNDLLENEYSGRIDYDAVYTTATEELGMTIPGKQQVVYYAASAGEYVISDGKIPNE